MTRADCAQHLLSAIDRLGVGDGHIDFAVVWSAVVQWWTTPVIGLGPSDEEELTFVLALAPAGADPAVETVFASEPPGALAGRDLVQLRFGREFNFRCDSRRSVGMAGGATLLLWCDYDRPWRQLRERSSWIEMGYGTCQIDAFTDGRDPNRLLRYVEKESGVLETAAKSSIRAVVVVDDEGDELLSLSRGADDD